MELILRLNGHHAAWPAKFADPGPRAADVRRNPYRAANTSLSFLLRHGEDVLDVGGYDVCGLRFTLGLCRNVLDERGQFARHTVDVDQRRTGRIGQLRSLHHALGRTFHGGHRIAGVGLNGLHKCRDLSRRGVEACAVALAGLTARPMMIDEVAEL